jgi:flagellum-specific peptidoglycan hydrolase FlgJ
MGASAYTKSLITTFVQQHGADIVAAITNTGLYFAAVVAQLSVESANGTSGLSQETNNYGGIKGDANDGVLMDTTEVQNGRTVATKAYFKKYSNFPAFMADYVSNLTDNNRYVSAGVFTATSPEDQITKMVNAGYSTQTAKAYLAGGVGDRITATRELFPFGQINSSANTPACCIPTTVCIGGIQI